MFFYNQTLPRKIVNEFHTPNKRSIVPAMLAWLYYGRSYECMVEQGEELTKRKDIPTLYKWLVSGMVKFIIRKSIANGMRTKEDWQVFRKQQKAIEENSLVEWAIEEDEDMDEEETDMLQEEQPKTAGRKADTRTLPELLIERHDILIERIGTRLKTHATETDIARCLSHWWNTDSCGSVPSRLSETHCTSSSRNKKSSTKEASRKHTEISLLRLETARNW